MNIYRLIYDDVQTIAIIEASGTTCANNAQVFEGSIFEIQEFINSNNITNTIPLSNFQ